MDTNNIQSRVLTVGPTRRDIRFDARELGAVPSGCALIRNRLTLIYSGVDVGRVVECGESGAVSELGCLAIGEVEASVSGDGPSKGQLVLWNGPHADRAILDPMRHFWLPLDSATSEFMLAPVMAEAQANLASAREVAGGWPKSAVVIGQGLLGHFAAHLLLKAGVAVTVVENSPKRLEFAKYTGLKQRIDTHNLRWLQKLQRFQPEGTEWVIEASGVPNTLTALTDQIVPGGRLVLMGEHRPKLMPETFSEDLRGNLEERGIIVSKPQASVAAMSMTGSDDFRRTTAHFIQEIATEQWDLERLMTNHSPAGEGVMEMKRLVAGVKSMLGVVLDWDVQV